MNFALIAGLDLRAMACSLTTSFAIAIAHC